MKPTSNCTHFLLRSFWLDITAKFEPIKSCIYCCKFEWCFLCRLTNSWELACELLDSMANQCSRMGFTIIFTVCHRYLYLEKLVFLVATQFFNLLAWESPYMSCSKVIPLFQTSSTVFKFHSFTFSLKFKLFKSESHYMYLYLFYAYYVTYYNHNVVLKSLFCFFCRGLCPLKPHQGIAPRPNGGTLVTPKPHIEIISSLQLPGQSHPCHCRGWIV